MVWVIPIWSKMGIDVLVDYDCCEIGNTEVFHYWSYHCRYYHLWIIKWCLPVLVDFRYPMPRILLRMMQMHFSSSRKSVIKLNFTRKLWGFKWILLMWKLMWNAFENLVNWHLMFWHSVLVKITSLVRWSCKSEGFIINIFFLTNNVFHKN